MHKSPPIISPKAHGSASINLPSLLAELHERMESKLGAAYVQEVIKHALNILNVNIKYSTWPLRLFTPEKIKITQA